MATKGKMPPFMLAKMKAKGDKPAAKGAMPAKKMAGKKPMPFAKGGMAKKGC